ncbi:hypothetical protein [Salidesulfovibrio brasiliensis]|uniref:hypothetical protein n=1 Tax=Salidesulfovibrio brasiliensis TaxID=221711 RepID=UPI000A8191BB|nr:hypothetical protein [Salidesulfovibrio brasiliensis]
MARDIVNFFPNDVPCFAVMSQGRERIEKDCDGAEKRIDGKVGLVVVLTNL